MASLERWCTLNDIYMNTNKTKCMIFGSKMVTASIAEPRLFFRKNKITRVKTYKYLGITLDKQLNYETHLSNVFRRVSQKVTLVKKMRFFLNKKAALSVYKNTILPIIEYGDIFFLSASATSRKRLQVLQNKALKCALGVDRFTPTNVVHKDACLEKLKMRRLLHVYQFMYKFAQSGRNLKRRRGDGPKTRSAQKKILLTKRPKCEKFKRSITYRDRQLWNNLSERLHNTISLCYFKLELTKWLPKQ